MPIYLLLMYVALQIVNGSSVLALLGTPSANSNQFLPLAVLIIHYAFLIIIINLPLAVGLSMGGKATAFLGGMTKKFSAASILNSIRGAAANTAGFAAAHTAGRVGAMADEWAANTHGGNSTIGRVARSYTTSAAASGKWGGVKSYNDIAKSQKEIDTKGREITRKNEFATAFETAVSKPGPLVSGKLKDSLAKLTEKEKLALGADKLKNPEIVKYLKGSDFEAIKKADDSVISEEDKKLISKAREDAFKAAIDSKDDATTQYMVENMDGKDLMKQKGYFTKEEAIKHMTISQLEKMGKENLDSSDQDTIKSVILGMGVNAKGKFNHRAGKWVTDKWQ